MIRIVERVNISVPMGKSVMKVNVHALMANWAMQVTAETVNIHAITVTSVMLPAPVVYQ